MNKICLFCKNFFFYSGTPAYSEYTPGSDAEMGCDLGLVGFDLWRDRLPEYRQKMLTAMTCPKFSPAQEYTDYLERQGNG